MTAGRLLLLGPAAAGKSTLLIQLYGRMKAGTGWLRVRAAPASLAAIESGLKRLEQGLAVEHTAKGTDVQQQLPAETLEGDFIDIALPDYAGEDLQAVVEHRRLPERWRRLARESEHWILLVRLSQEPSTPDILSRPIGVIARSDVMPHSGAAANVRLPSDMWSVELLQILLYARTVGREGSLGLPRLSLVLSCWDELDLDDSAAPIDVAATKLALLDSYCRSTWSDHEYRVFGLSAQGQTLDQMAPSDDYLDIGPQRMGFLVMPDGTHDVDLTRLTQP